MILRYLPKKKKKEKNPKTTRNPYTNYKNIQAGYRNGILDWKMCHAENEKEEKIKNERKRTTK